MKDFIQLEKEILEFWEAKKIFQKLQQKNKPGQPWSFIDGPITANNQLGVHHAWGRSLKDIFCRFKAMQGFNQRWQNGFDCQGLWVEVEVEKDLGLNSKTEIKAFGLARFSRICRARVDRFSKIIIAQSKRLGQWMDWENSYYTYEDKNIEYIWYFLKQCQKKGWLYKGRRCLAWCLRCGTSLSQHEMADSHQDLNHQATTVRFKLKAKNKYLDVWTTMPWTLPANTALAVHPAGKFKAFIGLEYESPFAALELQKKGKRKIIPWEGVDEAEGTGVVHIAPGCGSEDYDLALKHNLSIIAPIDEAGVYVSGLGEFTGASVKAAEPLVFSFLKKQGALIKVENYTHRYPICWRCKEELVFRVVEEWFIKSWEIKPLLKKAAQAVNWRPKGTALRMQDWLKNMGDWNISRQRFWGLPLPFYECACGEIVVVASKKELKELATNPRAVDALSELHRPWIDKIKIKCPKCGEPVKRVEAVGDCWLDAGIVPFSTLQYLENKKYWAKWFPADFIVEMREQIRLWYYSMLFMAVTLTGKAPYKNVLSYEKVYDEKGQPMHKSVGNAIWFREAVEKMGADAIRWLYAGQNPKFNVLFGYQSVKAIKQILNTFWNSFLFVENYASSSRKKKNLLDQWLVSRLNETIKVVSQSLTNWETPPAIRALEIFIEDMSNWYIRRSRQAGHKKVLKETVVKLAQIMSPFAPFISEAVFRKLTLKESVHLSDWPKSGRVNKELNKQMEQVRELSKSALSQRSAGQIKARQPLAKLVLPKQNKNLPAELLSLLKEEVNVKEIVFGQALKLDIVITPELKKEGEDRDLIRQAQVARKQAGLKPADWILLTYPEAVSDLVKKAIRAKAVKKGEFRIDKF